VNDSKNEPKGENPASKSDGERAREAAQQTISVDDSNAIACYANFCRVSSTPEELILDLGLNSDPYNATGKAVKVAQRIIMNHYTAKRLMAALSMSLQRHEQAFGVLETDVRKRVQPR
jgi:hypothetical protein